MILARIERLDKALFHTLFRCKAPRKLRYLSVLFSRSGDGIPYVLVALYLAWQGGRPEMAALLALAIGYLIERPVYFFAKNTFQRTRPCDCEGLGAFIRPSDKFSLPSGHSAAAWLFAVVIGHFYPLLLPYLYVWAGLVALSRVLLGVHYPIDILLGSSIGYSCAVLVLLLTGAL